MRLFHGSGLKVPSLLLAVAIGANGCAVAARRASDAWSQLQPGMSQAEVKDRIGSPSDRYRVAFPHPDIDSQTVEVWLYKYSGSQITAAQFAVGILALAAVFAVGALMVKGGGGGGLGGLGGGGGGGLVDSSSYRFYIGFGRDGLVREVTVVEPGR